jgi:hypothetical protein
MTNKTTPQAPACKSFYDIENQLRNCTCGTCPTTPPLEDIDFRIKPPEDIDFAWIPTSQAPAWSEKWKRQEYPGLYKSKHGFPKSFLKDINRIINRQIDFIAQVEAAAYEKGREDMAKELQGTDPY